MNVCTYVSMNLSRLVNNGIRRNFLFFSCRLRNIREERKKHFSDGLLRRQNSIKKLRQFCIYDTVFFFSFQLVAVYLLVFSGPTTITDNLLIKL